MHYLGLCEPPEDLLQLVYCVYYKSVNPEKSNDSHAVSDTEDRLLWLSHVKQAGLRKVSQKLGQGKNKTQGQR